MCLLATMLSSNFHKHPSFRPPVIKIYSPPGLTTLVSNHNCPIEWEAESVDGGVVQVEMSVRGGKNILQSRSVLIESDVKQLQAKQLIDRTLNMPKEHEHSHSKGVFDQKVDMCLRCRRHMFNCNFQCLMLDLTEPKE